MAQYPSAVRTVCRLLLPVVLMRSGGGLARRMTYPYVLRRIELGPDPTRLIPIPLYTGPGGRSARQGPYTEDELRVVSLEPRSSQ
jgi:hypothetical protein